LGKVRAYLELARPTTLLAPLVGGVLFSLMGYKVTFCSYPELNGWLRIVLTGVILALMNYTSNALNQIMDKDIDVLLPKKKNRPIPSGRITVEEAIGVVVIILLVALSLSYTVFGSYFGLILTIIGVFIWLYNSPPLRLRARLFWSNFSMSAPRGSLGIIVAYSAFANPLDTRILVPALALGIYVYGANTFKDYEDCEIDKKMGVRNFCTVYGKEKASYIILPFLYIPFIIFSLYESYLASSVILLSGVMTIILMEDPTLKGKGVLMWKLFYLQFALMMLLYTLPLLLQ